MDTEGPDTDSWLGEKIDAEPINNDIRHSIATGCGYGAGGRCFLVDTVSKLHPANNPIALQTQSYSNSWRVWDYY